jgi:dienelactone hydrolase
VTVAVEPGEAMTTTNENTPRIDVRPADALLDRPLAIALRGFGPGQRVNLRARARQQDGAATWLSEATFVTDATGTVDLGREAPLAGSYEGVDPNGLLWSLSPEPGSQAGRTIVDGLDPVTLELSTVVDGAVAATATVLRRAVDPAVTVRAVREAGVVANLFLPPGDGPFPTIVVVGGSGGGFADGSAALYASHGYAALSLAYFGVEGLPDELLNIPLEYFENAIDWVKMQPVLDTARLAISGTSRGGELALLLASRYPEFTAVVAYVPSGYLWGAISRLPGGDAPDAFPSWTYAGQALPYVARVSNDAIAPGPDGVVSLTPAYLRALDNEQRARAAAIAVERINGPVLLISGRDDALWPSAVFGDLIVERLKQQGFAHPFQHLSYEGAGHTLGPCYAPATVTKGFHSVRRIWIDLGGTPRAIAAAREDSWPKVLQFLEEHVRSSRVAREPALAGATR